MKRVIPELLLFFCLIPWGAALLCTVVDCIFNIMYLDWLWIPDWCMTIFNMASYYLIELTVFALFGIFAAYIFFGKAYKAVILTVLAFAAAVLFPLSRYCIEHMLLTETMYDTAMLEYFYENWVFVLTLLMNALLFLIAVLLTKLIASGFVQTYRTAGSGKMLSLRNPLNLSALIFCSAAILLASVLFVSNGVFSWEAIVSLLVEYIINIVRFFVIVFVASRAEKEIVAPKSEKI